MKHALVGSLTALLAGAGLALAQQPDTEYLPRPRNVSTPTQEVTPDQAGNVAAPILPMGDPRTPYGPPPAMIDPVCGTQGYPFRFWIEGDYHGWWVKQNHFPPLLASIPLGGLGPPGTQVLAGGDSLDRSFRNGGGLTLGGWFTDYQGFGIEGSFFVVESSSKSFGVAAPATAGSPIIVRPFFDVLSGTPGIALISVPGLVSGSAAGDTEGIQCDSGRFAGVNFDFIGNICCDCSSRFDFLIGYRYLMLDDRFSMTSSNSTGGLVLLPNGNVVNSVTDRINTGNNFHGFDIGLRGQWFCDHWMLKATAKVAFGATDESSSIHGVTTGLTPIGLPTEAGAGFLARPSNSGNTTTSNFAIVPELNLTVGYMVCDWMRITAGYNFLYWSSVARSADQINLNINRSEVPSLSLPTGFISTAPNSLLHCTDFWAHGVNLGLEIRF